MPRVPIASPVLIRSDRYQRFTWVGLVAAAVAFVLVLLGARPGWARSGGGGLVQVGSKLTARGEVGAGVFGDAVALSADGTTALVGGVSDNRFVGAAWVFERRGSGWVQQAKLTGRGEAGAAGFGYGVALSADGDTALVGAPGDSGHSGAVFVFRRRGSAWVQQAKLIGRGEVGTAEFGFSVALSADGNTAVVGGPDDHPLRSRHPTDGKGAVWIFARKGAAWVQQGQKLTGRGDTVNGDFGSTATISGDGRTALVGAFNVNNGDGAAWVFARTANGWAQQGGMLTGRGAVGRNVEYGGAVALSADGDTALVGGSGNHNDSGAIWSYTRTRHSWRQQGRPFTVRAERGIVGFGLSVAVSADGATALIGGWPVNHDRGAAWLFTRTEANWTQKGSKLTGSGGIGPGRFGEAVALSANAGTALIGAPLDNHKRGAVWTYHAP